MKAKHKCIKFFLLYTICMRIETPLKRMYIRAAPPNPNPNHNPVHTPYFKRLHLSEQ